MYRKYHFVFEPVSELVHSHREVSGVLCMASVGVVVIFWKQVHIMEEDATPVLLLQSFTHSHVQQFCTIKC